MGKKGLDRHQRRFSAEQQAASKFTQAEFGWGFNVKDPSAISKLISKVIK